MNQSKRERSLTELRGLVKRDPLAYKAEFEQQLSHYESIAEILKETGNIGNHRQGKDFCELIDFIAHCAVFFKKECKPYPQSLLDLLSEHGEKLQPEVRRGIVKALILMRNRNVVPPLFIIPPFFDLFAVQDKGLRKLIFFHIVNDIARINKKRSNVKLNKKVQNYLFSLLKSDNTTKVRKSLGVVMELFRKQVWQDQKTIQVVSNCCFSKHSQVLRNALRFFMGDALPVMMEENLEQRLNKQIKVNTKRKRKRLIKLAELKEKIEEKENMEDVTDTHDIQAIRSLDDPQTFAERLFSAVKKSKEAWDIRVLYIGVISRIMAHHQVMIFSYYAFVQNYLAPSQRDVTKLLAYVAQAVHRLVPPEILQPLVRYLADRFVGSNSSPEAVAAGINTIRAVCARQPLVMNADLLQDLSLYAKHRVKGINMAARSLIHLYRRENPELLAKKDQGKWKHLARQAQFGESKAVSQVKGLELLGQEQGYEGEELEEWMKTVLLSDEDFARIKVLRVLDLAEKYQVDTDRIVLDVDGEQGQEIEEDDLKGAEQWKREQRAKSAALAEANKTGSRNWREYGISHATKMGGTGTNEEKARKKLFTMVKQKHSVKNKNKRSARDAELMDRRLKKQKKEQNRHKRKFRSS